MLLATPATGASKDTVSCRPMMFEGIGYVLCDVDAGQDLRLWLRDGEGSPIGTFSRLKATVETEGRHLVFAMNAGMYHPDRRPVGLYVENGAELSPLVHSRGGGNFGLAPNGVFCMTRDRFAVIETGRFERNRPDCLFATQSGPMLVIDGELHPRFLEKSDSTYIRNGVGVSADGKHAVFAISDGAVNFHTFARLFRDALDMPQALYFDGSISRLYAPELGRDDLGFPLGPMIGLVAPN
jgi:uncharacterized protein YigE (DUF2233 family)